MFNVVIGLWCWVTAVFSDQIAHCEPTYACLCCFGWFVNVIFFIIIIMMIWLCAVYQALGQHLNLLDLHSISRIFPPTSRQSQKTRRSALRRHRTPSFPDAVKTTQPVQPASRPRCGRQMKPQTYIKYLADCMLLCKMHGEPQGHALAGLVCIAPFATGQVRTFSYLCGR